MDVITRAGVEDLSDARAHLASLTTDSLGLPELLALVATLAVRTVPGADGAGVSLLTASPPGGDAGLRAASDPFVAQLEEMQYALLGEGTAITAAREERTVRSGSLGGEPAWPRFGPRAGRLGFHSALSVPLRVSTEVIGVLSVYARAKDAFGDREVEQCERFAVPAALAAHNAQVLDHERSLVAQLQAALSNRPEIDQAIGILRGRSGGTAEQAFASLREMSQSDQVKLAEVARRIVDEAVRRARARHISS